MAKALRPYFILLSREGNGPNDRWSMQFGDYERGPVAFERDDMRDQGYRASNLKIVRLAGDTNSHIEYAVQTANG